MDTRKGVANRARSKKKVVRLRRKRVKDGEPALDCVRASAQAKREVNKLWCRTEPINRAWLLNRGQHPEIQGQRKRIQGTKRFEIL